MPNQNKPTRTYFLPLEEITLHILRYWKARQTDKKIVENLWNHYDTSHYGLGIMKFKEICNKMGLLHTCKQNHSIESIYEAMIELCQAYPNAGAREMVILLFHEKEMNMSRNLVISYCAAYEADLKLGFAHLGMTDIPMVTQSNPGTENYRITHAHTMLRQMYDPALQGTLQHHWMQTKKNVKPEITWSQLWCQFIPGFETLLDEGVENGWYNSDNTLQVCTFSMIFHWVFIPWLQCELDRYQDCVNNTLKRPDHNKVLPHSVPYLIYESAEDFGALDFKVTVKQNAIDHVRNIYVKPDHPVFDLVPKLLNDLIQDCYDDLGHPPVTHQSMWTIYLDLYHSIQHSAQIPAIVDSLTDVTNSDKEPLPLLENQKDLFFNGDTDSAYYMGCIHGGHSLDASDHCWLNEPGANLLPTAPIIEEEGLVITGFSDEEDNDETYVW
ncbi:uncharacterized protein BJ212DRAFT_1300900 [Suillus subaureus]|uniref:Uncharacterized protein n=1 Tax=Suillus subaureus TaxID=48587 RepID=A0A9P7E8B2_9AGAM|nr:uncharacterized protein BJ212DRAFT_1300900 [Suillus subaureus]KAG1814046.1 hypothetical protein BJ212DRAFT_1300900 [Suillus subaureus]